MYEYTHTIHMYVNYVWIIYGKFWLDQCMYSQLILEWKENDP